MSKSGYIFLFFLLLVMLLGFTESDIRLMKGRTDVIQNNIKPVLKTGDIIFQTSLSRQSKAIQLATNSKYSHVGLVYKEANKYFVLEAVQPVKLTPLKKWIEQGEHQHYKVKRLKNRTDFDGENKAHIKAMKDSGIKWIGKDYDPYFEWTDKKVYCSELVWKIYKEAIGVELTVPQTFQNLNLDHLLVQSKIHERFGDNVPLTEQIVSPEQLYNSEKLELVPGY